MRLYFNLNIILTILAIFAFSGILKSQFDNPGGGDTKGSITLKVDGGNFYNWWNLRLPHADTNLLNRSMEFEAEFDHSMRYTGVNNSWNKLNVIGWIDLNLDEVCGDMDIVFNETYKMHMGWRFNEERERLEFALFYHQDGNFVAHYLTDGAILPELGQWGPRNKISMYSGKYVLGMVANGKALGIKPGENLYPGNAEFNSSYLQRMLYFGGTIPAPHNMEMEMHDYNYDGHINEFQNTFNSAYWQQWSLTNFKEGDDYLFHASETVEGSALSEIDEAGGNRVARCEFHPEYTDPPYCRVKPDARIRFKAGNKVLLRPGFHAERGSVFSARIESKSGKNTQMPITPFNSPETNQASMNDFNFNSGEQNLDAISFNGTVAKSITEAVVYDFNFLEKTLIIHNPGNKSLTYSIFALNGQKIVSERIIDVDYSTDVSSLNTGVYVLHIYSYDGYYQVEKFIMP
jgi:hypothetical protein